MRDRVFSMRLSDEEVAYVSRMGGADYLRRLLKADQVQQALRRTRSSPQESQAAIEEALSEVLNPLGEAILNRLVALDGNPPVAPQMSALLAHAQQFFPPERVQQAQEGVHGV